MENIKVSKQELLTIVKENRKKHKEEYLESIKAYRAKAADLLTQELQKIVTGGKFQTRFDLSKPESHEKEYDLAIKMLEMSVDDVIQISQGEFDQLVNDEWSWKYNFQNSYTSNSAYFGKQDVSAFHGFLGSGEISSTTITFAEDEIDEEEI